MLVRLFYFGDGVECLKGMLGKLHVGLWVVLCLFMLLGLKRVRYFCLEEIIALFARSGQMGFCFLNGPGFKGVGVGLVVNVKTPAWVGWRFRLR